MIKVRGNVFECCGCISWADSEDDQRKMRERVDKPYFLPAPTLYVSIRSKFLSLLGLRRAYSTQQNNCIRINAHIPSLLSKLQ